MVSPAIAWSLEEDNPSIRHRTLTEILGVGASDEEAVAAYEGVWESKAIGRLLSRQDEHGIWVHGRKAYGIHTSLRYFTALSELGVCRRDSRIDRAAEYAIGFLEANLDDGGDDRYAECSTALLLRALVMAGYHDEASVRNLIHRHADSQLGDGGFNCERLLRKRPDRKSCYKAAVSGLLLYAACARRGIKPSNVGSLVEYFTGRDVFYRSTDRTILVLDAKAGWRSIDNFFPAEPMRVGLPMVAAALSTLGVGNHPGTARVWSLIDEKRDARGRLSLEGTLTRQPCTFGKVGDPSKWVTFYAELATRCREATCDDHKQTQMGKAES